MSEVESGLELARTLEAEAVAGGFAVFGLATRETLAQVPAKADPDLVLPGYRAVVIVGVAPDGYVRVGPKSPVMLAAEPSQALVRSRELLVAAGHQAVPPGAASISLPRVAVAAGLGVLSPNGMLVVNRYGLSLQLFALVTDAPLPATPLPGSRPDRTICRSCRKCLEDCPAVTGSGFQRAWCTGCAQCLEACPLAAR